MKKFLNFLILFIFYIFLTNNLTASSSSADKFTHAFNTCVFAPLIGIYSFHYEYLLTPSHGMNIRFDYDTVPKAESYTDAAIEANSISLTLNYRWHLSKSMNSIFIGLYGRYRAFNGTGTLNSTNFDLTVTELATGLNAGKRWAWDNGINIVISAGYGISKIRDTMAPSNSAIVSAINRFKDEHDIIYPYYGEISAGYAF